MLIRDLQLLSDDLEGTARFYHEVLGLHLLKQSGDELSLAAGETVLTFHKSLGQRPQYHFAFNIPCNKTREALNWMEGKASLLEIERGQQLADFMNWNAEAFYFLDNNENIVEFIARKDLHNEVSLPFDGSSILSVSEIGIVADDVPRHCQDLIEDYGVGYFSKQPPLPHFAALGDDQGLLIVVAYRRDWYPTKIPSTKHWLKAEMEVNGRKMVLEQYNRS